MSTGTHPSLTEPVELGRLNFDEFVALESAWDDLVRAASQATPFVTHAWLRVWWQHFGADQEFVALVVRRGKTLLAAAPMALRRSGPMGMQATVAGLVGTGPVPTRGLGLADKSDLLVRADSPESGDRLLGALLELLDDVDVLDLKGIDDTTPSCNCGAAAARWPRARTLERSVSPYLALGSSWDDYLASRSGNFRKHLRKYWRLLEKIGPVEVSRLESGDDLEAWLEDIAVVNGLSWKATRGTNLFRHPRIRAFVFDVVRAMAARGEIDLHRLRVGGSTAAYELCFDVRNRIFSYNSSFRLEHGRSSPGTALTAEVIRLATERGRTEYDMLRGAEDYKARWSSDQRRELRYVFPANRLRARAYVFVAVDVKERLKRNRRLREAVDRIYGWTERLRHRDP